jgi:hypothetical protein
MTERTTNEHDRVQQIVRSDLKLVSDQRHLETRTRMIATTSDVATVHLATTTARRATMSDAVTIKRVGVTEHEVLRWNQSIAAAVATRTSIGHHGLIVIEVKSTVVDIVRDHHLMTSTRTTRLMPEVTEGQMVVRDVSIGATRTNTATNHGIETAKIARSASATTTTSGPVIRTGTESVVKIAKQKRMSETMTMTSIAPHVVVGKIATVNAHLATMKGIGMIATTETRRRTPRKGQYRTRRKTLLVR